MTIMSAVEIPMSRTGKATGVEMTETRRFLVKSDSPYETMATITESGYLPAYLEPHPQSPFSTCRDLSMDGQPSKDDYFVTASYSSAALSQEDRDKAIEDPRDRPALIDWQTKNVATYVLRDILGNAIVNSAGDYFDPAPERPEKRILVRVSKNLVSVPAFILDYEAAINDADFEVDGINVPKGCARCGNISVSAWKEENGFAFRTVSYELELRAAPPDLNCFDGNDTETVFVPQGWTLVLPDQGLRVREVDEETDPPTVTITNMTESNDDLVTSPCLLDGHGQRLEDPTPETAIYLCWENLEALDFSDLPLE